MRSIVTALARGLAPALILTPALLLTTACGKKAEAPAEPAAAAPEAAQPSIQAAPEADAAAAPAPTPAPAPAPAPEAASPAAPAAGAAAPAAPTDKVVVTAEGSKFDPAIEKDKLPTGVWFCDMGTVHYARTEKGDGKCPLCKMDLKQKQ